jgi:hypothetical protein
MLCSRLRKPLLRHARDRGLLHPEDTGTITHGYSHTPILIEIRSDLARGEGGSRLSSVASAW